MDEKTKSGNGSAVPSSELLAGLVEKQFCVIVDVCGMEETLCFNEEHAKAVVAYALFRGANKIGVYRI